jgi:hypothetical protein
MSNTLTAARSEKKAIAYTTVESRGESQATSTDSSKLFPSTKPKLSLSELANAINHEHQLCQEAYKSSLLHARRTGDFLLQAKAEVKISSSGRWLPWLKENCPGISERTARAYMQIARKWEQIEKTATVADFGFKDALKLLSESGESKKPPVGGVESTDVVDAEWTETDQSPEQELSCATLALKERDRVIVTDEHPLFAGQHGLITGRPSPDAAIVALDGGAREYILIRQLQPEPIKPLNPLSEPKSKAQQLFPSIQPNPDVPPNEPLPTGASLVNVTEIANGKPDVVAVEIAIGVQHLTPELLDWVISSAASNGLSDSHLKAVIKAAKRALNQRHHPEYFGRTADLKEVQP